MADSGDLAADAEAFAILGSQTRLRILLYAWYYRWQEGQPVGYAELKDLAGIDDSGKFYYHLEQLRGRFVEEERGGYVPTWESRPVVRAIQTRRLHGTRIEPEPLDTHCIHCGERLVIGYDWKLYVGCDSCWERYAYRDAAPAAVEKGDVRELMRAFDRARRRKLASFLDGVCPECGGPTRFGYEWLFDRYEEEPRAMQEVGCGAFCEVCHSSWGDSLGELVLAHPVVGEYCREHGIDRTAEPFWRHEWVFTDLTTTVRSDDPWEVEKVATLDDCRLAVVFDEDGAVETITHVDLDADPTRD